jgi:hypothetical protein
MLKRVRVKWGVLICGSTLAALGLGACVVDFLEDWFIFRAVN